MIEIVEVGAYKLDERNNVLTVQIKRLAGDENGDQADLGFVRVWGPGGECWIPVAGTQALYVENIGVIAFQTILTAQFVGTMRTGDKAILGGEGCRTFWKALTREVTTLVKTGDGKDAYTTLNGTAEKYQAAIKGCGQEIAQGGHKLMEGGSYLELAGGVAALNGNTTKLGPAPLNPIATAVAPVVGVSGSTVPSSSVIA